MYLNKNLVYLELHKTGCTHIRNTLKELLGGEFIGKHNQIPLELYDDKKFYLGSIRNPWEWYVSLWAYGCDSKGAIHRNVTDRKNIFRGLGWQKKPRIAASRLISTLSGNAKKWAKTYQDVNDEKAFREWLYMMNDKKYAPDLGESYGESPISRTAGLMSYRYIKLFCTKVEESSRLNKLKSIDDLVSYDSAHCFINSFIRNEQLEDDLFSALFSIGYDVIDDLKIKIRDQAKTNTSSRHTDINYYYNKDTIELIKERDKLIVDKFNYSAPDTHSTL